jgi:hypothetical protein
MLALFRLGVQRREREKWIRRRDCSSWETGQKRRDGLRTSRALPLPAADRFARLDPSDRFVARDGLAKAQSGRLLQPLVAAEEKGLVGDYRAAKRSAELVELQILFLVVVLARGIQRVVAEVVEYRAAEAIAAALADDSDVSAGAEAALRGRESRIHTELGDRFHGGLQPELRSRRIQIPRARVPYIRAVHAVVVQVVLLVGFPIESNARPPAVAIGRGAGRQRHQIREVPAVDREALQLLGRDVDAQLRRGRVDNGDASRDRHRFRNSRDAKRQVHRLDVAHTEDDLAAIWRESAQFDAHFVGTRAQVGDRVPPLVVGQRGPDRARLSSRDRHGHAGQNAAV